MVEQFKSEDGSYDFTAEDLAVDQIARYLDKLGLSEFEKEINQQKLAARISNLNASSNYWQLSEHLWQIKEDRILQDAITLQSALFDKASSYNTVIMSLGFAGFFTLWGAVREGLSLASNACIGGLLGFSLLVFILWTLANSWVTASIIKDRAKILSVEFESRQELIEAHSNVDSKIQAKAFRFQRYYPSVFFISTVPALVAGVFLLAVLLEKSVGFQWSDLASIVSEYLSSSSQ